MTSEYRAPSQIPRNGTYIALAATPVVFTEVGVAYTPTVAIAQFDILQDMGKTVYIADGTKVLRKVRTVKAAANNETFFINIGGNGSVVASAVARL